jgi:hypothetical protein
MKVTDLDDNALFAQALHVMNRALDRHREDFPYKQILEGFEKFFDGKTFVAALYKSDASSPYAHFTVRFEEGRFDLVSEGKRGEADLRWSVSRDYLQRIVEDPKPFVEHPEKLDWEWIKSRLGIGSR